MSKHTTKDLYLAALCMSLGMMLTGGVRAHGSGGPVAFELEGEEEVWERAWLAYRNDEPIPIPVGSFARSVRALKNFVHDVE